MFSKKNKEVQKVYPYFNDSCNFSLVLKTYCFAGKK